MNAHAYLSWKPALAPVAISFMAMTLVAASLMLGFVPTADATKVIAMMELIGRTKRGRVTLDKWGSAEAAA